MRKSNSFKVPEKYFENIDVEILEKLKFKKNVFTFPQNYFENIDSEKIIEKDRSRSFYRNLLITSTVTMCLMILLIFNTFTEKEFVDETFLVNDILEENFDYMNQNIIINRYSSNYIYQNYDNQIIMSNFDSDFDYLTID
ncbi:MAG: hypothetical protein CMC58_02565 [Flavobacteriaceae bacterium]|jgi:hypothetical protein|nr:hypothetical protein [Flavobacteriaceae bacterium]|tara:strand:+ start:505 stop:924 length:420 start_codon:yes stop_codon:yes gene_type:complete